MRPYAERRAARIARLPVGTPVTVTLPDDFRGDDRRGERFPCSGPDREWAGTVVRHGRDAANIYTEVRLDSGARARMHPTTVRPRCICPDRCDCDQPDGDVRRVSNYCREHNDLSPDVVPGCPASAHRNGANDEEREAP